MSLLKLFIFRDYKIKHFCTSYTLIFEVNTAKEIDENKKVTPKHTIWMNTEDLLNILKPQRTILLKYLKDK